MIRRLPKELKRRNNWPVVRIGETKLSHCLERIIPSLKSTLRKAKF
jgi:hypothetical protein